MVCETFIHYSFCGLLDLGPNILNIKYENFRNWEKSQELDRAGFSQTMMLHYSTCSTSYVLPSSRSSGKWSSSRTHIGIYCMPSNPHALRIGDLLIGDTDTIVKTNPNFREYSKK